MIGVHPATRAIPSCASRPLDGAEGGPTVEVEVGGRMKAGVGTARASARVLKWKGTLVTLA